MPRHFPAAEKQYAQYGDSRRFSCCLAFFVATRNFHCKHFSFQYYRQIRIIVSEPTASTSRPRKQRSFSRTPDRKSPRLLPPIRNDGAASTGGCTSPAQQYYHLRLPSDRLWSRYHEGCMEKSSMYLNWFAVKIQKSEAAGSNEEEELAIAEYLDRHRDFLEAYIAERVPSEELERWHLSKLKPNTRQQTDAKPVLFKNKAKTSRKQMFMDLHEALRRDPSEYQIMLEFTRCLTNTVGVDAYRIYKLMPENTGVVQYFYEDQNKSGHEPRAHTVLVRAGGNEVFLVLEVARRGAPLRLSRLEDGNRFPDTPHFIFKSKAKKDANHVMYQPVLVSTGETGFVIEMWRYKEKFRVVDEEACASFMLWGSLALHYCSLYLEKMRERNMTDFLLHVVKAIFEEMISLDQLIKTILEFAQHLVNADRASLFLLDDKKNELVSTVFDLKFESGQDKGMEKKEIRMPVDRGIAGYVAKTGETMNIPDAYADYRFNREVDAATGYRTMNILCMPIKVEGEVIGVVQMVNKRSENNFGRDDEVAFEIFSTFFGLALKHARLYDRIMRNEQKYKVALEVLSYHNTCRENEVRALQCDVNDNKDLNVYELNDFYLDPYRYNEYEKCKSVLTMFNDLFGINTFDSEILSRFVLTVKKNYRTVPYHNFDHGWAVANAMYNILKTDHRLRFDYTTRLALFVACLCHDLDHRGYTNKYMSETASPLAAMYTTSTLEHHHFNITVTILQQEGHNIFSHMSGEEYKSILGQIRQAILATDLAAFFPNLEKIKTLHEDESNILFDWSVTSHRDLAMAISMTSADLSAAAKPWEVQIKTVKVIFEEFYDQGDKEYAAGRTPIPMMDRNKTDQQPASQVGFLSQICIPCYEMLWKILPNTKPMYIMASRNLIRWKTRADMVLHHLTPIDDDDDLSTHSDLEGEYVSLIMKNSDKHLRVNSDELLAAGASPKSDPADTLHDVNLVTWEEDNYQPEDKVDKESYKNIDTSDDEEVVVKPNPVKELNDEMDNIDTNEVSNKDKPN